MNNETFSFGNKTTNFNYDKISGLGESNYENEDLFNTEVSNETVQMSDTLNQYQAFNSFNNYENDVFTNGPLSYDQNQFYNPQEVNVDPNFVNGVENVPEVNNNTVLEQPIVQNVVDSSQEQFESVNPYEEQNNLNDTVEVEETTEPNEGFDTPNHDELEPSTNNFEFAPYEEQSLNQDTNASFDVTQYEEQPLNQNVDSSYLDTNVSFESNMFNDNYNLPVVNPTVESKVVLSETPISELEKLTQFEEEKIQTTDIKSLFDRVGVNVKEASDIFKKNTQMKEKIDSRFEELKKLQSEVEKSKKSQYDEINSYKEDVLGKLTEKKEEIERRLNKLKEFQSTLEKEKQEFEQYRKAEKEEIERVQKEVQEAYESRREELNHIEDVLRKQKDALDEERSQLSLDRIQYESDKNELANNLLKFNEIVDSFTNGMDKINKE